uniref:Uncharacterized protein n=1 Tax=Noctiluca scintillans TaxID=2966 RepID=A0A7S1A2X7_NOCSC|mmetsp:Transcript_29732/g.78968  ORF Transcript_29732/g.78968 Transcript_29732/m.78968 type:complete len:427 (+) Transcript_29732:40-1320(+)
MGASLMSPCCNYVEDPFESTTMKMDDLDDIMSLNDILIDVGDRCRQIWADQQQRPVQLPFERQAKGPGRKCPEACKQREKEQGAILSENSSSDGCLGFDVAAILSDTSNLAGQSGEDVAQSRKFEFLLVGRAVERVMDALRDPSPLMMRVDRRVGQDIGSGTIQPSTLLMSVEAVPRLSTRLRPSLEEKQDSGRLPRPLLHGLRGSWGSFTSTPRVSFGSSSHDGKVMEGTTSSESPVPRKASVFVNMSAVTSPEMVRTLPYFTAQDDPKDVVLFVLDLRWKSWAPRSLNRDLKVAPKPELEYLEQMRLLQTVAPICVDSKGRLQKLLILEPPGVTDGKLCDEVLEFCQAYELGILRVSSWSEVPRVMKDLTQELYNLCRFAPVGSRQNSFGSRNSLSTPSAMVQVGKTLAKEVKRSIRQSDSLIP